MHDKPLAHPAMGLIYASTINSLLTEPASSTVCRPPAPWYIHQQCAVYLSQPYPTKKQSTGCTSPAAPGIICTSPSCMCQTPIQWLWLNPYGIQHCLQLPAVVAQAAVGAKPRDHVQASLASSHCGCSAAQDDTNMGLIVGPQLR